MNSTVTPEIIWAVIGAFFSILIAANAFWIVRLINKIESIEKTANDAAAKVRAFEKSIGTFVKEMSGIREDLKEIHSLDKSLGKLEAQLQLLLIREGFFPPTSGHE